MIEVSDTTTQYIKQVYEYLATRLIIFDFHGLLESVMRFLHYHRIPVYTSHALLCSSGTCCHSPACSHERIATWSSKLRKIQVRRGPPLFLMVCKRQLKSSDSDSMNSRVANVPWQNLLHDGRLYVWWMRNSLSLWHCRRRCHFRCSDLACPPTATEPAV